MLPQDPFILLSYLNTKLRDEYASLDELCAALNLERGVLEERLAAAGFTYDAGKNRFQ